MRTNKLINVLTLVVLLFQSCASELKEPADNNTDNPGQNDNEEQYKEFIETCCEKINANIAVWRDIIEAHNLDDRFVSYKVNTKEVYWTLELYSGKVFTIYYGIDGGVDISVDTIDGDWCWHINDEYSRNHRLKVTDNNYPIVKYADGWRISYDSGKNWFDIIDSYFYRDSWIFPQLRCPGDPTNGYGYVLESNGYIRNYVIRDGDKEVLFLLGERRHDFLRFKLPTREIQLEQTELGFKNQGESRTVSYTTTIKNATFDVSVSSGWQVSVEPETSTSGTITITAPETIKETTITITATGEIGSAECQLKCDLPKFYFPKKEHSVGYNGGKISVAVESNIDFSAVVMIPDDAKSWIELVMEETTDEKIVLQVSENEEAFSRKADVLCLDEYGVVLDKFSIYQNWNADRTFDVQVPVAGELQECLESRNMKNVKNLKISGTLNEQDFIFIKSMKTLKYLDISDVSVENLPDQCFSGSSCVTYILPKTLAAISERCFNRCKSIEGIVVPASCLTIGELAFGYCTSLSSVSFESGSCLTTISTSSFENCKSLKTITIPSSCETIGDYAFYGCTSLADLSCVGESALVSIGTRAFRSCDILHRIDMRNSTKLKEIETEAFYGDDQIYSFQIGAVVPPDCSTDAFGNVGEYSVLKVPSGSEEAYKSASGWGGFYKIIAVE